MGSATKRVGSAVVCVLLALAGCSGDDEMSGNTNDSKGSAGAAAAKAASEHETPKAEPDEASSDESSGDQMAADETDVDPSSEPMMEAQEDPATPSEPAAGDDDVAAAPSEPRAYMEDAGNGWSALVEGKWDLPANSEGYRCVRFTLPEDLWISQFRPVIPLGTHHTLLTVGDPSGPDGVSVCTASVNAPNGVFGSGVGSKDFSYPEGVAIHLHAGQQLVLNLHLFNTSDKPMTGVSGTLIKTIPEEMVEHAAALMLAGTTTLNIPVGGPTTQFAQCAMDQDATLVAVFPHMHQLGVHLSAVAESSTQGEVVLHDDDYDFDTQIAYPLDRIEMKKGDLVKVECTYMNTTDADVHFGDSSLAEMCFAGLIRYPEGGRFVCTR
jgi:hypothetical protein